MKWYEYWSWGRYPRHRPALVWRLWWRSQSLPPLRPGMSMLARGYGRSYGDSCLNEGGMLLDTKGLKRVMVFDAEHGILRCEAGASLAQVLSFILPRGYFLPVTPGTQWVSLGGALANDVHGKNHHWAGSFGCHVRAFEVVRSAGECFVCTPTQNAELFRATIGGLGLTGLVTWVELQLRPVETAWMRVEIIPFERLRDFFRLSQESDEAWEYTVAWIDVTARGRGRGRGIFWRGNHAHRGEAPTQVPRRSRRLTLPVEAPSWVLNPWSARSLNALYYYLQRWRAGQRLMSYEHFFYPLDTLGNWNRLYGRRGLVQYQCVLLPSVAESVLEEILDRIAAARVTALLGVLKRFGDRASPGMLSFPRPGTTLAVDLALEGERTWRLLERLDELVWQAGGALYPAKDARMSPEMFAASFPQWREFCIYCDPAFSSSFWRRVTAGMLSCDVL